MQQSISPPELTRVVYDVGTLRAAWTAQIPPGFTGFRVTVTETNTGTKTEHSSQGSSTEFPIVLAPADTYAMIVSVLVSGVPTAISNEVTLINNAPGLASVVNNATNLDVSWDPAGGTQIDGYVATVTEFGANQWNESVGVVERSVRFDLALTSGIEYTAQVRATNTGGVVIGPAAQIVNILTTAPTLTTVANGGTDLTVIWGAAPGSAVEGYAATLQDLGSDSWTNTTDAATLRTTFSRQLTDEGNYTTWVRASGSGGTVFGPPSQVVAPLRATPQLVMVDNAGTAVTVTWDPMSGDNDVTGFLATLTQPGIQVWNESVGVVERSVRFDLALTSGIEYTAQVRATNTGGVVIGPAAQIVNILTTAPTLTTVANGANVSATVASPEPAGTNAWGTLLGDGAVIQTKEGTGLDIAFDQIALVPWMTYLVSARWQTAKSASPPSMSQPVLVTKPTLDSVEFDGATATVSWSNGPGAPPATGGEIRIFEGGTTSVAVAEAIGNSGTITPHAGLNPGGDYTVVVASTRGPTLGPPSEAMPLISALPTVSRATYDGGEVTAFWLAPPPGRLVRMQVLAGGTVVASTDSNGTQGSISMPPTPGRRTVARLVAGISVGPPSAPITIIGGAPLVVSTAYDGRTLTVKWKGIADEAVTGYLVQVVTGTGWILNAAPVPGKDTSTIAMDLDLPSTSRLAVNVAATGANTTGPGSAAFDVLTIAPQFRSVGYDGVVVSSTWARVPDQRASGYLVTLDDPATPVQIKTTDTTATFPLTTPQEGFEYEVTVQAITEFLDDVLATGPAVSSGSIVEPSYWFSTDRTALPYLFRSATLPPAMIPPGPADIVVLLPDLFSTAPVMPPAVQPFTLAAVSGEGDLKYSLTIAKDSDAWKNFGTSPMRSNLRTAYVGFLRAVATASPVPSAIPLLQETIAAVLPMTFAETLYYHYGFSADQGFVDLRPGMRLRLDYEEYQFIGPSAGFLAGFVGGGSAVHDIGGYVNPASGDRDLGFDAFLSALNSTTVDPPTGGGAGGVIDLYRTGLRKPYYRLYYPATFPASSSDGWQDDTKNVTIVAADSWLDLDDTPSGATTALFFRGRVTATPEVRIVANGAPEFVPLGTTVGQMLRRTAALPSLDGVHLSLVDYRRSIGNAVTGKADLAAYDLSRSYPVRYGFDTTIGYSEGFTPFDMPMLAGDQITFPKGGERPWTLR